LQLNDQKEEFSYAYIQSVAAVAGCPVQYASRQIDQAGVDLSIIGTSNSSQDPNTVVAYPRLDLQVKCTAANTIDEEFLRYPLSRKNYNELRSPYLLVPRLLVIVVVPDDISAWLTQSEDALCLHHCAYWISLNGAPETLNLSSVTVYLPRKQIFTPDTLQDLMQRITVGDPL
jgi:hypothetical protein